MNDARPRCEHGVVYPQENCASCLRAELARRSGCDVSQAAVVRAALRDLREKLAGRAGKADIPAHYNPDL